jgi:endonuclease/exonuclease/phosphatase (EEP) superfamily protein YafD
MEKSIRELNPDVMVIVEFGSGKLPLLDRLKADFPYQYTCQTDPPCETALISKYPISDFKARAFWDGPPYISASLGPDWNYLTIFGVHTTRFPHSRAQFTQARAFVKMAEGATGLKIVMGDFNSTSFSRINQTIADGLDLQRLSYLPTWPASQGFPQLAIDHIFASTDIVAVSGEVIGDNAGSDHYPISIAVSVPVK